MNSTVYKYPIHLTGLQVLTLPAPARILDIQIQDGYPQLWALVEPDQPMQNYEVITIGTGQTCYHDLRGSIFQKTLIDGSFVWHIFVRLLPTL
jgi:hypothetical protein